MAIWQFSLYLIPKKSVEQMFDETPSMLSMDLAGDIPWWTNHQPQRGFENSINAILHESDSWSESLRIWGIERSNSILVRYLNDDRFEVEEIEVRIDVSNLSWEFVSRVCQLAASLDCMAWTKTQGVLSTDLFTVEKAIRNSRAMKFIQDPTRILQSLKQEEFEKNG